MLQSKYRGQEMLLSICFFESEMVDMFMVRLTSFRIVEAYQEISL